MIYNATLDDYKNVCNSCTVYILLFVIAFLIIIGISNAFIYFHWYLKKVILKQQFIKHINDNPQTN